MSIHEVMIAASRLLASTEALAALGARAGVEPDSIPSEIAAAIDDVLTAAGVPDLSTLPPPQRAMVAAFVRSAFGQAGNLLTQPARDAGWAYTDSTVLEGQGRGSMILPSILAQTGEFGEVTSFLDVGTGVGWLAVGAAQVWPDSRIVGIDTWEPSLERARTNVADTGLGDRIELRNENLADLGDRDRFDLTWLPSFFMPRDVVAAGLGRILAATRPGGQVVVARYDPPSDELANATLRLRTIRDGGAWLETEEIIGLLGASGWADVRTVPTAGPMPLTFVAGRRD